ncbi:hypothetical protein GYMLUDRAFT_193096, partial [Collybiopsis luxurians FD-317 M1]
MFQNATNFNIRGGNFNVGDQVHISGGNINIGDQVHIDFATGNAILSKIPYSPQAFFDTDLGIQYARRSCTPGTRVQVLEEIKAWAMSSDPNSPSAYWISGMAGTGKSTIAMSTCKILRSQNILAGSFFCSRQIAECRDYRRIIPTLCYQLAKVSYTFATALVAILNKDFDIVHKEPSEQIKHLLIKPWEDVRIFFNPGPLIFVIDALDEC